VRRLKRFVEQQRRETQARLHRQSSRPAQDAASQGFLQGKLEALDLLSRYIDHLEEQDALLNGSASAFSPQG
jgi:hypothetical protein